jgi:hypothetical protein
MDLLQQLPLSITASWLVVLAWAAGQALWFQHLRVAPPPPPPKRRDTAVKRSSFQGLVTTLPTGGSPEFLAELGLQDPHAPADGDANRVP